MCACADAMGFFKEQCQDTWEKGEKEKQCVGIRKLKFKWCSGPAWAKPLQLLFYALGEGSRHRLLCLEFSGSKQHGTCTNASPSECSDAVGQRPEEQTATIEVSSGRNEATCPLSPFPTSRPQQSFSLESMTFINYLRVSYMHMVIFSSPSFFFSSSTPSFSLSNFMSLLFFE